ncbi:MAG TPA: zinc-binding dehydrogenase [Polyangiaceae bacterium]|nr:zinc-binding dehydrogenase [Polyangiaceae bacterium]
MLGDPFGSHRVLEPPGTLPQAALRLDNDAARKFDSEIHLVVETLNIDAASFQQMMTASGEEKDGVSNLVRQTVRERGKQHNPVTGSGGMLLGRVGWVGSAAAPRGFTPGDRIATLASLSLTPLALSAVHAVRPESAQLDVEGTAIVFLSAPMVKLPADLPERLALAVCDVAGAVPQVLRHAKAGDRVVILGAGGRSGLLACAAARQKAGAGGFLIGVEPNERFASELEALGFCDRVIRGDARETLAVREAVLSATGGQEADFAVSCVTSTGVEPTAILVVRPRGTVYFFAMSTSFAAAALFAEGVSRDIDMFIGNGYVEGHVEATFDLVRAHPALRELLQRRYA